MKIIALEDMHIIADNLAVSQAIFAQGSDQYRAELRLYLQKDDCLGIRLGRHDSGLQTGELEGYLAANKMELRHRISTRIPDLKQAYKQKLLVSQADVNWSVVNAS